MAVQRDFPSIYVILKSDEEKGGVGGEGGYPSVAAYSRKIFQVMIK